MNNNINYPVCPKQIYLHMSRYVESYAGVDKKGPRNMQTRNYPGRRTPILVAINMFHVIEYPDRIKGMGMQLQDCR